MESSTHPREAFDVIVVGFGCAGTCAAIEAANAGANVLALDKYYGGGATALSGGIVYAGGGTPYQRMAGYADSPENMYAYLKREVEDAVSDDLLREFCETSVERLEWLEAQGATFEASLCPYKTSYPTDEHYLYFSGNEQCRPYTEHADPAPRGHRQVAPGLSSGSVLYDQLKRSAIRAGVTFRPLSPVHELNVEDDAIRGVRYRHMEPTPTHKALTTAGLKLGNWMPLVGSFFSNRADGMFERHSTASEAHAPTVIVSAGGFQFNRNLVKAYADPYRRTNPLGTDADDGMGILLGTKAGGRVDHMDSMSAWRFLTPPEAFTEGVSVGVDGQRIVNEDLYGATFTEHLIHENDGKGYLILDATSWKRGKRQLRDQAQPFQLLQGVYLYSPLGHTKADSLSTLASSLSLEEDALVETIEAYNEGARMGIDPAGKQSKYCRPLEHPPFYAVDISIDASPFYPTPSLTLGGLVTDDDTANVLDDAGEPIPGLYAAGRSAVGICSNHYVSGLAIADCVFSGRKAGRSAAERAGA